MMTFDELKRACEEKGSQAKRLYDNRAQDVILKDIKEYMKKYPDTMKIKGMDYVYNDKIFLSIYDDLISIVDRRGTAYGWSFEVVSDYYVSYIFEYEGRPVSVKDATPKMENEIKKILDHYNAVIEYLKKNQITDYTYLSVDPEIRVNSFEDVIKTINEREPIIC